MPIILNKVGDRLGRFYQGRLDYLHEKYHQYPTTLNYGPMTDAEKAELTCNDALGRDAANRVDPGDLPTGRTIF